jgi:hypothetical protein
MRNMTDFVTGQGNRLLRDFLAASVAVTAVLAVCLVFLSQMLEPNKNGQPLPKTIADAGSARDTGIRTTTVIRSVLDDPVTTGSIGASRPLILDPCTGAEKSR